MHLLLAEHGGGVRSIQWMAPGETMDLDHHAVRLFDCNDHQGKFALVAFRDAPVLHRRSPSPPYWQRVHHDLSGGIHVDPADRALVRPWLARIAHFWNQMEESLRARYACPIVWSATIKTIERIDKTTLLLKLRHGPAIRWHVEADTWQYLDRPGPLENRGGSGGGKGGGKGKQDPRRPWIKQAFATVAHRGTWYNLVQCQRSILVLDATGTNYLDRFDLDCLPIFTTVPTAIDACYIGGLLYVACTATVGKRKVTMFQRFVRGRIVFDQDTPW